MFEKTSIEAAKIVSWLQEHGDLGGGEWCRHFEIQDEPWERFTAEWQDLSDGHERLLIGYWFENGDGEQYPDPQIIIAIRRNEVVSAVIDTQLASIRLSGDDAFSQEEYRYVEDFLRLVFERHLAKRNGVLPSPVTQE